MKSGLTEFSRFAVALMALTATFSSAAARAEGDAGPVTAPQLSLAACRTQIDAAREPIVADIAAWLGLARKHLPRQLKALNDLRAKLAPDAGTIAQLAAGTSGFDGVVQYEREKLNAAAQGFVAITCPFLQKGVYKVARCDRDDNDNTATRPWLGVCANVWHSDVFYWTASAIDEGDGCHSWQLQPDAPLYAPKRETMMFLAGNGLAACTNYGNPADHKTICSRLDLLTGELVGTTPLEALKLASQLRPSRETPWSELDDLLRKTLTKTYPMCLAAAGLIPYP